MNTIKIQNVSENTILLEVNGQSQEILNRLDALQKLMDQQRTQTFQTADKIYNIQSINEASFGVVMDRAGSEKLLPKGLAEHLITSENLWVESLREELQEHPNISVGNKPGRIFHHYGWLVETFLLKMASKVAADDPLRRLSFLTEAYQSSLRYLAYIQLAELLAKPNRPATPDFFQLDAEHYEHFDFLNLLSQTSGQLKGKDYFIPEMEDFIDVLFDKESELYEAVIFMEQQRGALIGDRITAGKDLGRLLDEYLTALVYWLRHISFLAQYRLVSIKDIHISYQLGTPRHFVHTYGELHGMYDERASDFSTHTLQNVYTYSHSVLLFRGSSIDASLSRIDDPSSFLSLSPLIIDQSALTDKETQTPEIYYYIGKGPRQYQYAQYRNELLYGRQSAKKSNKFIIIKKQNTAQPKWNKLYKQIDHIFEHFQSAGA